MTDLRVGCRCYGNGRFQDHRPLFFDMCVLYNYNKGLAGKGRPLLRFRPFRWSTRRARSGSAVPRSRLAGTSSAGHAKGALSIVNCFTLHGKILN
jgi:hypothetical protein